MRVGDQEGPRVRKPGRYDLRFGRSGIRNRNRVLDMKLTLSAMIEKAVCCIAALLNLSNDKSRTNCVDRSGGDENAVASRHRVPRDKIREQLAGARDVVCAGRCGEQAVVA